MELYHIMILEMIYSSIFNCKILGKILDSDICLSLSIHSADS